MAVCINKSAAYKKNFHEKNPSINLLNFSISLKVCLKYSITVSTVVQSHCPFHTNTDKPSSASDIELDTF